MMRSSRFEDVVLPHLDAAFNLARWLMGEDAAASDAVQDAAVRAMTHLAALRGASAKPWFLAIVRNVCFDALRARSMTELHADPTAFLEHERGMALEAGPGPEALLERSMVRRRVNRVLRALPVVFREVLILRDIEDLSYEDIARVIGAPPGTVMSRLARARRQFRSIYESDEEEGSS